MIKRLIVAVMVVGSLMAFLQSCEEDSFSKDLLVDGMPSGLTYATTENAREFSRIESGAPTISTDWLIPEFEITSVKNEDKQELGEEYWKSVRILNVTRTQDTVVKVVTDKDSIIPGHGKDFKASVADAKNAGIIVIQEGNNFGPGVYYFSVKVTTIKDGIEMSEVFEDVYKLVVGPQLVRDLLYSPIAQNLIPGEKESTSQPYLLSGNEDVVFGLKDNEDKLSIDPQTGVISLQSGYNPSVNDTIYPTIEVTSNISEETTQFQGEGLLMIVVSNEPVELPRKTVNLFYPTLQAENTQYGYKVNVIDLAGMPRDRIWWAQPPSPMAAAERPSSITNNKAILLNPTLDADGGGHVSVPHESEVILNTQDLSKYAIGFDIKAVFYTHNNYVLYQADGTTPAELEVYVSTDYDGDDATATWTKVNDDVISLIDGHDEAIQGTPYPGNNGGADPEGRKNPAYNNYGKWVRGELNLNPYKDTDKFTLKFRYISRFGEPTPYPPGPLRAGQWRISDVHYIAIEEEN